MTDDHTSKNCLKSRVHVTIREVSSLKLKFAILSESGVMHNGKCGLTTRSNSALSAHLRVKD